MTVEEILEQFDQNKEEAESIQDLIDSIPDLREELNEMNLPEKQMILSYLNRVKKEFELEEDDG